MGCPGWPLCDGDIGPILEFQVLMEQPHRYMAAMATVLVLATARLEERNLAKPAVIRPGTGGRASARWPSAAWRCDGHRGLRDSGTSRIARSKTGANWLP